MTVPPAAADALTMLRRRIAFIEASSSGATRLHAAQKRIKLGHAEADARIGNGLAPAVLHEIFAAQVADAAAATGFALALVSRFVFAKKPWLWVRQDFAAFEMGELYGPGLAAFGLNPNRLIIVTVAETAGVLRAAEEALRCRSLSVVLIEPWGERLDLTCSRRLHLAAVDNRTTAILLRSGGRPAPSAAATRWLVGAASSQVYRRTETEPDSRVLGRPCFDAALIRNRQGQTGRWAMEWNNDDRIFHTPATTFSVRPYAVAADRPPPSDVEDSALRRTG